MKPTSKTDDRKDSSTSVVVVHEKDDLLLIQVQERIPVLAVAKHLKQL